jgi:hypothetical protein
MVPLPQARSSAGQYLSQPQQIRSECAGSMRLLRIGRHLWAALNARGNSTRSFLISASPRRPAASVLRPATTTRWFPCGCTAASAVRTFQATVKRAQRCAGVRRRFVAVGDHAQEPNRPRGILMEHFGVAVERGEPGPLVVARTVRLEPGDQWKQLVLLGRHPREEPSLEPAQLLSDDGSARDGARRRDPGAW